MNMLTSLRSLQYKIMLTIVTFVTIVILAMGGYWLKSEKRNASRSLDQQADRTVMLLARSMATPMWNLNMDAVASLVDAALADPELVSVKVFEAENNTVLMSKSRPGAAGAVLRRAPVDFLVDGSDPLRLGTVEIVYSSKRIKEKQSDLRISIVTLNVCLLVALLASSSVLVRRLVTIPVERLKNMAGRIAAGDLDTRIEALSDDELGTLGKTVNQMADELSLTMCKLRASEEKFRTIYETAPVGICQASFSGRLLSANPYMAASLGYSSVEELLAVRREVSEFLYVHPEDRDLISRLLREHGNVTDLEIEFLRKNGQTVWGVLYARLVFDETGKAGYVESIIVNVTERKLAEAALLETNVRYQRLVESTTMGVVGWDALGDISEPNEAYLQITGCSREDIVPGNRLWERMMLPDSQEERARLGAELSKSGAIRPYEKDIVRKDGQVVPVLVGSAFLHASSTKGVGFILDLTERKQANAERVAREAAEAANLAKSAFLANMSHELRSPLNIILGFARLIGRDLTLPPKIQADLNVIRRSSEHLYTLINQVLDLSKIEAGRAVLQATPFDLPQMLMELSEMFSTNGDSGGPALSIAYGPQVPRFVRTDRVKLSQVLINLLGNSLKFTRSGNVSLRVTPSSRSNGDMVLAFVVQDTGPGIATEELARLFDPFVQAEAGRRSQEGTGLGLSICSSFVQLMGGQLRVESEPGQGTTVSFDIPVEIVDPDSAGLGVPAERQVLAPAANQPRYRILVTDDQAESRQLFVRLLAPLDFELREAANGAEAIAIWRDWRPHLIFMDIQMPVMGGIEATLSIRAMPDGAQTRIIASTASSFKDEKEEILHAGCDDVLLKPFRESELVGLLEKHLGLRFLYADQLPASNVSSASTRLDPRAVAGISEPTRALLVRALIELDTSAIHGAIAQLGQCDPELARSLDKLASEFQYRRILENICGQSPESNDETKRGDDT